MMESHPAQKDLIFIGVDDCLERCEDNDELIDKMHAWIEKICSDEPSPKTSPQSGNIL